MVRVPEILNGFPVFQANGDYEGICLVALGLVVLLVILYIALYLYQKFVSSKKKIQHLCEYCGHMVYPVSNCCHADVEEKFLHGICRECSKECFLVCEKCKRRL